jgi:hypothetical protein
MGLEIKKRSTVMITLFDGLAKGYAVFLKVVKSLLVPRIDIAATAH